MTTADPRLRGAAELLLFEQRLRAAPSVVELGFLLVNDLHRLVPGDVAALWLDVGGPPRLAAVSALPEPATDAPFTLWMSGLCRWLVAGAVEATEAEARAETSLRPLTAAEAPASFRADWADFLPPHALWLPLRPLRAGQDDAGTLGGLLLGRAAPWREEEIRVLTRAAEAAAHALEALLLRGRGRLRRGRRRGPWLAVAAVGLLAVSALVPVPLSVLAPASVEPRDPLVVRAPVDGVIATVTVTPNAEVAEGERLLTLDPAVLRAKLEGAVQDLDIAQAEYRQAQQTAMRDPEAASRLAVLAARVRQAEAQVDYLQDLLERTDVRTTRAGIAILPDPQTLIGRPVQQGERLLTVADPRRVQVEIWLPVDDVIPLTPGSPVHLYLNVEASAALAATLRSVDYEAQLSPAGVPAFRLLADLDPVAVNPTVGPPRIGQRGTASLSGGTVSLFHRLFRRPLAALRPWLPF